MYIIFSLFMSIINFYLCRKEIIKRYKNKNTNHVLIIIGIIFIFLLVVLFYVKDVSIFVVFFGANIPILLTLIYTDVIDKCIPNSLTLTIAINGLIMVVTTIIIDKPRLFMINNIINAAILFIIYLILACITNGALGGGDIKLIGAVGLFFSLNYLTKLLVYPFILGSIYAMYLLIVRKQKKEDIFSFAPSMIIAFYIISLL